MSTALPSTRQLEFQDWEFGLFIHLGLYTYAHIPGERSKGPHAFHPDRLDCDQWVSCAKKAGMRYAVLTAKHHDGFCLWPTAHGGFSVGQSSWRNGTGDVVGEFTSACRRHGLKVGIYYSPLDNHNPSFRDNAETYDDYFIAHMRELLGNYGSIDLVWFDGAGSENHVFDWSRIMKEVRHLQPDILVFNMGDPDYRWVGNEFGFAPSPTSSVVETGDGGASQKWLPAECDCRMRLHSWGFRPDDEHTVKSVHELMGLYYSSVGRNCNLLLNIGPNPEGLLPDKDASRLVEFGAEVRRRFASPIATMKNVEPYKRRWIFQTPQNTLIDHVVLQEDILYGERIKQFALRIHTGDPHTDRNPPITVYEGSIIGHRQIIQMPPISIMNMILDIVDSEGEPLMRNIEFHCVCQNRA